MKTLRFLLALAIGALSLNASAAVIDTTYGKIVSDFKRDKSEASKKYFSDKVRIYIKVQSVKGKSMYGYDGDDFVIALFKDESQISHIAKNQIIRATCQVSLQGGLLIDCEVSP